MPEVRLQPLPAAEAVDYFRQKGYRVGFDYRDVWQQEHQAAFTVAKATQLDVLQDIRGVVDNAIAKGTTFATFQRQLRPALQAKGWWGRKDVVDPATGDTVTAQLGSPTRLRRIFDTNLATAYSEGQAERIERNKALFPFLEYVRSAAVHPRPSHLAYAGLVLPADDPFWRAHMPVKEWGCKCTVIQHTARTLERDGLKVGKAPAEVMRTYTNPRTGDVSQVPAGVDPAFNYPPGGRRANLGRMMMEKANTAAAMAAARVLADGADRWAPLVETEFGEFVGRYTRGERREVGTRRVAGVFGVDVLQGLQAAGKLPEHSTINVNLNKLRHLVGEHRTEARKAKGTGEAFVTSLPGLLRRVGEAWLDGDRVVMLCTAENETERVAKVVINLQEASVTAQGRVPAVVSMELIKPADFGRKGLIRLDRGSEALR